MHSATHYYCLVCQTLFIPRRVKRQQQPLYCSRACQDRAYREKNRTKRNAYNRQWRKEHADTSHEWRKTHAPYFEEWRKTHPTYFEEWRTKHPRYFEEWRRRNPGYNKQWRRNHPERARDTRTRYAARKRGAITTGPIRHEDIARRDNWRCHICHKTVTRKNWSLDHLIPLSSGGSHTPANIALAHVICNGRRRTGTKIPAQLRLFG